MKTDKKVNVETVENMIRAVSELAAELDIIILNGEDMKIHPDFMDMFPMDGDEDWDISKIVGDYLPGAGRFLNLVMSGFVINYFELMLEDIRNGTGIPRGKKISKLGTSSVSMGRFGKNE